MRFAARRRTFSSSAAIVLLVSSGTLSGCATAAGCGAGTLAGMGLAGLVMAGSEGANGDAVGVAVAVGGLFGVAAGCTGAAVAAGLARKEEREKAASEERAVEQDREPSRAYGASPRSPGSDYVKSEPVGPGAGSERAPSSPSSSEFELEIPPAPGSEEGAGEDAAPESQASPSEDAAPAPGAELDAPGRAPQAPSTSP